MNIFPSPVKDILLLISKRNFCNTDIVKNVSQSTDFLCAALVSKYRLGDPLVGGTGIHIREDITEDQRAYKIRYYLNGVEFHSKITIDNSGQVITQNTDFLKESY